MQLIRGLQNLTKINQCIATIGNFDGMHIAHQKILTQLKHQSITLNLPSVVISFNPSPNNFFGKKQPSLSSFKDKYQILKNLGIDIFLLINFNAKFANLNPQIFIDNILVNKLNVIQLFIGDDFHFGKNRMGNFELLANNIKTLKIKEFLLDNNRVSSSYIRKLLYFGDFRNTNKMLGKKFTISGKVISGKKLGRTIGFPTANIAIKNRNLPISGVFTTDIIIDKKKYKSIANIGFKPTINGEKKLSFEVHIFDFNNDIYGKFVTIIFKNKIRDEQKFKSLDELKQQINKDIVIAKKNTV